MKELEKMKAGDVEEYLIDEKTLILEPIPYGRLKKLIKYVMEAMTEFGESSKLDQMDFVKALPDLLEKHAGTILPLLFNPKKHSFMNQEWIDENLTVPVIVDVVKKAIVINGLNDFFAKARTPQPAVERPLAETVSGTAAAISTSSGSITSSL